MILLSAALDVIKRDNLVAMQNDSGAVLLDGLKDLEARYPGVLKSSRGLGKLNHVIFTSNQSHAGGGLRLESL